MTVYARTNISLLVSFWCTHDIPICIENWLSIGTGSSVGSLFFLRTVYIHEFS